MIYYDLWLISPLNMNFTKENGEFDIYADHVELDSEKMGM